MEACTAFESTKILDGISFSIGFCRTGICRSRSQNGRENIEIHSNLIHRALLPVQLSAGATITTQDVEGKSHMGAKYTGLHALRHFYASWRINRKQDGGLELPGKVVQYRLGHSSIAMTMDVYGHLFTRGAMAQSWRKLRRLCWLDATKTQHGQKFSAVF